MGINHHLYLRGHVQNFIWADVIIYRAEEQGYATGYRVDIHSPRGILESYSAGANYYDSQADGIAPESQVQEWGRTTAQEMLVEHKVNVDRYDAKIEMSFESFEE